MASNDRSNGSVSPPGEKSSQNRALEWAALITGRPEVKNASADSARNALLNWWTRAAEGISRNVPDFPESFCTTRFKKETRFIEGPLTALNPVFDSLLVGESSFFEAMEHLGRNFAWDQERLLRWKTGLESLAATILWIPAYLRARNYLAAALPIGREEIDQVRDALLQATYEPYLFLEAQARLEFEEKFVEFKKGYGDAYYLLHEDALHIAGSLNKDEAKIDPVRLRNLDLLSTLPHMDKSYLNRVKLMAKWVQRNQCNLPVRQILERYPRCYCNFNPSGHLQPGDSAARINSTINDGVDYFRMRLRKCEHLILAELKAQQVEDPVQRTISALLGDGPTPALKPQTVKILHKIISKYPNEFLAVLRKK
jgi:hypothetical protein